jgi:bacteriocin-like protein
MATEDKNKRVVQIEIDDEVKKLTIEGVDKDAQVVMREELSDDELDNVAGGYDIQTRIVELKDFDH